MSEWIWETSPDGVSRYVLGTAGENPLVCIGVNPSTAVPNQLDRTVTRVSRFAERTGHDSWVMLNVYPQISTDPAGLHRECDPLLMEQNLHHIAQLVDGRPLTVLAAWGVLVESRPYLVGLVGAVVALPALASVSWVSLGAPTKAGHPRHPLYVGGTTPLEPFDVAAYVDAGERENPRQAGGFSWR